ELIVFRLHLQRLVDRGDRARRVSHRDRNVRQVRQRRDRLREEPEVQPEERWLGVWERVPESVSRWAIGLVVIATIAGTTQGVTAWLLGSSFALGLGVIAGLLDMIPNLGATLAGFILVPALWAESGIGAAVVMLIVVLVYQQIENNILTPKIQGRAVNLSGFFIIVAVTLFGALLGVLGALTAVPLAATLQILTQELTKARRERVAEARAAAEPS